MLVFLALIFAGLAKRACHQRRLLTQTSETAPARDAVSGWHRSIQGRDAMPMRVGSRMPQLRRDPLLERLRDEVLQPLSFIVQLTNGVIEDLKEKRFDQPMVPHNLQGASSPGTRQLHAFSSFIVHQRFRLACELLEHIRDGRWRNIKARSQFRAADSSALVPADGVNSLQIIVDRFRIAIPMCSLCSFKT